MKGSTRKYVDKNVNYVQWNLYYIYIYIYKSKVGDHSRGWPEGSLSDSLLHQGVGEGATPFPGLLHFTLDLYLIMLSVKQGGIKYHFLSLWYDSTWERTQVSWTIGEHSNRLANVRLYIYIFNSMGAYLQPIEFYIYIYIYIYGFIY